MSLDLTILLVCSIASLLLGVVVFARNPNNSDNQRFAELTLSLTLWTSFNFFSDNATSHNLLYTRLAFFFGVLSVFSIVNFISKFPRNLTLNRPILYRSYRAASLLTSVVVFFPQFIVSVSDVPLDQDPTGEAITTSFLYPLYLVYLLCSLLLLVYTIINQNNTTDRVQKSQTRTISTGIIIYAVLALATNVVLPLVIDNWSVSRFGPVFSLIFLGTVSYSIAKHKLFDIRLVIARTLGYVLSVGSLVLIYGLLAFSVLEAVFAQLQTNQATKQFVYTALAVLTALTYQPLKGFFDKWTNKLFYRDAYDAQALLDNLNRVLVSTLDPQKLLIDSSKVINKYIKSDYIVFSIKSADKSPQRLAGATTQSFNSADLGRISQAVAASRVKTTVADELTEKQNNLSGQMRQNDIAIIVRLTDNPGEHSSDVGYMILGNKKSGSPFSGQDIKVLEIIADELVIAIQNALRFEEIQKFNITLQEKVDDATKKLRDANKRLIELDQTKDDFISMASHQLRTPLTSIKGYVSMVMEGDAGKITKKQNELLNQSFISAQRMVYLIADLLNVSRLRTGKFVIDPEKTNLADVIDGEMAQLTETAKGRKIELKYNKPSTFPELMLDENKTRQVIMNFIDNAIYYTPTDGHVNVNLEDKGETIEFTVVDDGIGVPKSVQHNLFNKFYRADNAKKARPDGTGLGLFMAKKVVVAQGGSIIFKSTEGKGSTFGFSFNKKPLMPENFKGVVADKK